ncbi:MAG: DUF3261 domain-containing protein [bacterium]
MKARGSGGRVRGVVGLAILPLLVLVSCRSIPPVSPVEAARIPAAFEATLPGSFNTQQTLLFEFRPYWWWPTIRMTALGYATVNRKTGDYAVVCLSPLGVKIFDVACTNGVAVTRMTFPVPGDRGAAGKAISDDIGNLYFNLVPPPDAVAERKDSRVIYRQSRNRFEFDATSGRLVRKVVWNGDVKSTVEYGGYRQEPVGVYPASMTLENSRYRYRLLIQTLKFQ